MALTWTYMNRLRKPLTEKNYRIMRAAYLKVGRDFVDRVGKYGVQVVTDGDIKTADVQPVIDAYTQIITDTAIRFAKVGRDSFPKRKKFDAEEFENSRWIRDITAKIPELTKKFSDRLYTTTIDELIRVARLYVDEGIGFGWSMESIADSIVQQFMGDFGDSAKWMARRVAQTETIRASNYGTKEGVNGLGIEYVQSWLVAHDGRERDSHAQAAIDNDRIPSTQLFRVGGYECEYPGDPSLPPEESINCRCSWTASPVD